MYEHKPIPPRAAQRFLLWFLKDDLAEEVLGDLDEKFFSTLESHSPSRAKRHYWFQVFHYLRPFALKKYRPNSTQHIMIQNYLKISYRNLRKNRGYAFINIGGLAIGMAVAMIIGLWVHDEISHDKYHKNYKHIAQVMKNQTANGEVYVSSAQARPLEFILRDEFGENFEHIVMSSWPGDHVLSHEDVTIKKRGNYMQAGISDMLSLNIEKGTATGFDQPDKILLSSSTARALFSSDDPVGRVIRMNNDQDLTVIGVYADLPSNTSFEYLQFIAPWSLYVNSSEYVQRIETVWDHSFQIFVQIAQNTDMQSLTDRLKPVPATKDEHLAEFETELFLHPMKDWHLRSEWRNGIQRGGNIQYVVLFSMIGVFVLLLACINFMNLSTARSQKRAREVGIRKSVGSRKGQLIDQFLSESFFIVIIAFVLSALLVLITLPEFNDLMSKQITFPWNVTGFWLASAGFIIITSLLSGSYPAFYLSSFKPVDVLKGATQRGPGGSLPRKILVVMQFTVSVSLIICTLLIFRQIQYSKDRPIGYDQQGLIHTTCNIEDFKGKYDLFHNALIESGAVIAMSASHSPLTGVWSGSSGFSWEGKPADFKAHFGTVRVSHDYGRSIGWKIMEGRDFSRELASDSNAVIINEAAVKYMGLEDPLGKYIYMGGSRPRQIIGVVENVVMESPYQPVEQSLYTIGHGDYNFYNLRLNPRKSMHTNIAAIEEVFKKLVPGIPFTFEFVDEKYARKFRAEERIGNLSRVFTALAIFISCLGLFGLASFMAEQRTKEIGIRKVLGATVFNLWKLLTKDFLFLVMISCLMAVPLSFYFMSGWIGQFEYRIDISPWIFIASATMALIITLLTVSYQSIRTAIANPVNSLRSE